MKTRTIKLACIQIAFLLVYCGLHAQQQVSLIEAKKAAVRTLNKYMTGSSLNFNMQDIDTGTSVMCGFELHDGKATPNNIWMSENYYESINR